MVDAGSVSIRLVLDNFDVVKGHLKNLNEQLLSLGKGVVPTNFVQMERHLEDQVKTTKQAMIAEKEKINTIIAGVKLETAQLKLKKTLEADVNRELKKQKLEHHEATKQAMIAETAQLKLKKMLEAESNRELERQLKEQVKSTKQAMMTEREKIKTTIAGVKLETAQLKLKKMLEAEANRELKKQKVEQRGLLGILERIGQVYLRMPIGIKHASGLLRAAVGAVVKDKDKLRAVGGPGFIGDFTGAAAPAAGAAAVGTAKVAAPAAAVGIAAPIKAAVAPMAVILGALLLIAVGMAGAFAFLVASSKVLGGMLGIILKVIMMIVRPIGDILGLALLPILYLLLPVMRMMRMFFQPAIIAMREYMMKTRAAATPAGMMLAAVGGFVAVIGAIVLKIVGVIASILMSVLLFPLKVMIVLLGGLLGKTVGVLNKEIELAIYQQIANLLTRADLSVTVLSGTFGALSAEMLKSGGVTAGLMGNLGNLLSGFGLLEGLAGVISADFGKMVKNVQQASVDIRKSIENMTGAEGLGGLVKALTKVGMELDLALRSGEKFDLSIIIKEALKEAEAEMKEGMAAIADAALPPKDREITRVIGPVYGAAVGRPEYTPPGHVRRRGAEIDWTEIDKGMEEVRKEVEALEAPQDRFTNLMNTLRVGMKSGYEAGKKYGHITGLMTGGVAAYTSALLNLLGVGRSVVRTTDFNIKTADELINTNRILSDVQGGLGVIFGNTTTSTNELTYSTSGLGHTASGTNVSVSGLADGMLRWNNSTIVATNSLRDFFNTLTQRTEVLSKTTAPTPGRGDTVVPTFGGGFTTVPAGQRHMDIGQPWSERRILSPSPGGIIRGNVDIPRITSPLDRRFAGRQMGGLIDEPGLYRLHARERVVPEWKAGEYERGGNTFNFNVEGNLDDRTARFIVDTIDRKLRERMSGVMRA